MSLRVWRERLAVFVLCYALTLALLGARGAGKARFTQEDEPSHFMTALMVRDYLAARLPAPPLEYAQRYYLHYPKVALGHWPPFFPTVAGLWMLLLPATPASVLLLMAAFTSVTALLIYTNLRGEHGAAIALGAGALYILLPMVQTLTGQVMPETLAAMLIFAAVLCFGRYLDTGRTAPTVWFGLLGALACLTKPSGFALALTPLFAVLLTRRFDLLRRVRFWIPAIIVGLLCGPWYYFAWPLLGGEHMVGREHDYWLTAIRAATANASLFSVGEAGILGLALIGLGVRWRLSGGMWTAAATLPPAVWLFHSFLSPHTEPRLNVLAFPAVCLFVGAGWRWVLDRRPDSLLWGSALSIAVLASSSVWVAPHQPEGSGYRRLASLLVAAGDSRDCVILVSGTSLAEGSVIAQIAIGESRPGHIVLRASKQLSSADWMGRQYRLRYGAPDEIQKYLESVPVRLVAAESAPQLPGSPHHRLLLDTLAHYSDRWERLQAEGGFDVYRLVGQAREPQRKIRIDMPFTLGRPIQQD